MTTTATAPKLTPAARRYAAINRIVEVTYSLGSEGHSLITGEMGPHFAARIREELAGLGRTERWTGNVEGWARMVEEPHPELDAENAAKYVSWAINQGAIYTGYAAD